MEEILCIGCGATIQTTDKAGLGFTPQSALEKGLETGEVYCQRCFRLRHYNEITDVQLTDDDFLKLLHEVGDSDALVVNVIDIFDFNGSVIPGLPRFVSGNDVLLVGNKKISFLSQLSLVRLASGSWNVPMKKVFVQSMWS